MSDAAIKDQPGVAVAATEAQPVAETTPAVATVDESEKEADAVPEAQNGDDKSADVLKTTARIDHKDHKKNRKYDPSTQPVTDDPIKIRGQVCDPRQKPTSHPYPD
jgi:lupus La protein